MRLIPLAAALLMAALPARADVEAMLDRHILPGLASFADAAAALADTAAADCTAPALRPGLDAAFDAWLPVGDLRIGPSETGALSVAFWPDPRGFTQRTLARLVAEEDPVAGDVAGYAEVSIAARGLYALEMLIHDPEFAGYGAGSYACRLAATMAADLDRQASALATAWTDDFAGTLRSAGAPDNAIYLTSDEALRAVYTQILAGLEFAAGQRLGLPMGTFDRPRPALAEARRSGRSLRHVELAAQAGHDMALALAGDDLPGVRAAMDRVRDAAGRVTDPAFADIDDPAARLRVEALQQAVRGLHDAIAAELGAPMGIAPGFNAQDGD